MQKTLHQQLKQTQNYCKTLEQNFKNNLDVIEERQNEIEQLSQQLSRMKQQNQLLINRYEEQESSSQLQIRLVRNEYVQKLQQKQMEMQELAIMIQTKMRKQLQSISLKLNQELKSTKNQLLDRDQTNRRLLHENSRLNEIIKQQKNSLLQMQSQISMLNQQKNSMSSKMALHQQQLQGIKSCNSSWQDMLKDKLKQSQKQRQAIEEEFSQYKLTVKEKLKKQKDDLNKKILQLSQEKENQIREISHQYKQFKYRYQKIFQQNRDLQKELQHLRQQKNKLQVTVAKYKQNELKSNFQKNQKEYEYLLKIFQQDKRDLKNQIDTVNEQKKSIKEELDQANSKREAVEKAVQRFKVDANNKMKQIDDLKKQIKNMKSNYEGKMHEYQVNHVNDKQIMMNSKPIERGMNSKGFQNGKGQAESKIFTEEQAEAVNYFQGSMQMKSPKNNNRMASSQNREARLMKKISELQIELQQYKSIIKKIREQTQNLKKICDEDKNREVSLYRDKANVYWEKANDKEQQLMSLRQQYNELKSNYGELNTQVKKYKEYQHQNMVRQQELQKIRQQVRRIEENRKQLEEQLQIVTKERDLLEEMSSQLRAENHSLREHINTGYSVDLTNPIQNQTHISQLPQEEQTIPYYQNPIPQRQKIPKKLHDLVRQKKMLSISGKRAAIEQRMTQTRLEHIGTDSQKQVLQKIKIKNKTPPKIANYAQMKKEKQRRTSSKIETLSQKQVFQRLKARQTRPLSPEKPQKGINYLQLRDLQGLR